MSLSTTTARRTKLSIWFDGVDISATMAKYILSMTYTDNEDGESDDLQITLQDRDGLWRESWIDGLVNGAAVGNLSIKGVITTQNWQNDNRDLSLPTGAFELDSVELAGPPSVVTLKATALPFSSQIRQTLLCKSWEAYTLSGIAAEMAASNGMDVLFDCATNPTYDRVEQYYMSDIAFLETLCTNGGISLKVTNNTLVLFDQATYEAKDAILEISPGCGYTKYKLSMSGADTEYASCRVSYADPATGTVIEGFAYDDNYSADDEDNQQLEITAKVASIAEAESLASAQLRRYNKYAKTAAFTITGDVAVVAGVTIQLTGWGVWDGKYMVYQAKHDVGSSGYTVQIKLRQILEGY